MKSTLLRPAGWIAHWTQPYSEGDSEIVFEAQDAKVVAKIHNVTLGGTCEHDVTITADLVKFNGCYDDDIALRFDPNDSHYPFKGASPRGYEYKLRPR